MFINFDKLSKNVLILIGDWLEIEDIRLLWEYIPFYQYEEYWEYRFNKELAEFCKLYEIFDNFIDRKYTLQSNNESWLNDYDYGHKLIKFAINNKELFDKCIDFIITEDKNILYNNVRNTLSIQQDALVSIACYRNNYDIVKLLFELDSWKWSEIGYDLPNWGFVNIYLNDKNDIILKESDFDLIIEINRSNKDWLMPILGTNFDAINSLIYQYDIELFIEILYKFPKSSYAREYITPLNKKDNPELSIQKYKLIVDIYGFDICAYDISKEFESDAFIEGIIPMKFLYDLIDPDTTDPNSIYYREWYERSYEINCIGVLFEYKSYMGCWPMIKCNKIISKLNKLCKNKKLDHWSNQMPIKYILTESDIDNYNNAPPEDRYYIIYPDEYYCVVELDKIWIEYEYNDPFYKGNTIICKDGIIYTLNMLYDRLYSTILKNR